MELRALCEEVFLANLELRNRGLAIDTWGNASGIDRDLGLVVIKPSGVAYDRMTPGDMAVVTLNGESAGGTLRPSSDTPTHLALYRAFPWIGGVAHTHSVWATVWAQAGRSLPCMGTTHADSFFGAVPCTRPLTREEIRGHYEAETGNVIVETMGVIDPARVPAVLVAGHGPFAWGKNAADAVRHAAALEQAAHMAWAVLQLDPGCPGIDPELMARHFLRKHGENAYYGNP